MGQGRKKKWKKVITEGMSDLDFLKQSGIMPFFIVILKFVFNKKISGYESTDPFSPWSFP